MNIEENVKDNKDNETADAQAIDFHSFSHILAKQYGYKAALLLGYIAWRIEHSNNERSTCEGGKRKWYYHSVDKIAAHYPYWSPSSVHRMIKKLAKAGVLLVDNFNKLGFDRTCWYALNDREIISKAKVSRIGFRVDDAETYGVVGAVLLRNHCYWIKHNRLKRPDYKWHRTSASELATILPFKESTIRAALTTLSKEDGPLTRQRCEGGDNAYEYCLRNDTLLDQFSFVEHPQKWDTNVRNRNTKSTNRDMHQQKWDIHHQKWDDNTYSIDTCSKTPLEDSVHRNTYIERSTESTAVSMCFCVSHPDRKESVTESTSSLPHTTGSAVVITNAGHGEGTQQDQSGVSTLSTSSPPGGGDEPHQGNVNEPVTSTATQTSTQEPRPRGKKMTIEEARVFLNMDGDSPPTPVHTAQVTNPPADLAANHARPSNSTDTQGPQQLSGKKEQIDSIDSRPSSPGTLQVAEAAINSAKEAQEREKAEWERRRTEYDTSCDLHRSPDTGKESDPNLSAEEKVRVLRNGIESMNRVGLLFFDPKPTKHNLISYTEKAFGAAKRFFQANPDAAVEHLLSVLNACATVEAEEPFEAGKYDVRYHVKAGTDLMYCLVHLEQIVTLLQFYDCLPPLNLLTKEELTGKAVN